VTFPNSNGPIPVPAFLENPRQNFFPMFPLGSVFGRHPEPRPQPVVTGAPPSSGSSSVGGVGGVRADEY